VSTRYASVLGLGFGDCGKGLFVDALTGRWRAHTVVRFNGGAQAGHNVVTPATGNAPSRHHTFSQFGSGTFAPGVRTLLADPMIVHPTALLVEAEALGKVGVHDALADLMIDGQCRVTTPLHQAAGRLRELLRGAGAHGTCGVGVGETVRHALQNPEQQIRYADLAFGNKPQALLDRLQGVRKTLLGELLPQSSEEMPELFRAEIKALQDETLVERWLGAARALARQCPPASLEAIRAQLTRPGCVLFEGAQGVLLDEWRGFHPHTTWSSINTGAVESVAAHFGIEAPIEHYGVMRAYLTRHGEGPLPTHDEALDAALPEPHNSGQGWQGAFRRGHPDAVLLRYAIKQVGALSGLFVSHLDVFERGVELQWCEAYSHYSRLGRSPMRIERLHSPISPNLDHQKSLTELLFESRPIYAPEPVRSVSEFLERVENISALPVALCSHGPTAHHVRNR
jgi:adenylosuccinate synthase